MGREGGRVEGRKKEGNEWVRFAFLGFPATLTGQHSLLGPVAGSLRFPLRPFFPRVNSTLPLSNHILLAVGDFMLLLYSVCSCQGHLAGDFLSCFGTEQLFSEMHWR